MRNNFRNDLCHVLKNVDISDKHLLPLVSAAVVNKSEHNEKLVQRKKDLKVHKVETDENQDNPLLTKLRKIQFEHLNQLAAFRCETLEIKQAVSLGHASGSKQTLEILNLYKHLCYVMLLGAVLLLKMADL